MQYILLSPIPRKQSQQYIVEARWQISITRDFPGNTCQRQIARQSQGENVSASYPLINSAYVYIENPAEFSQSPPPPAWGSFVYTPQGMWVTVAAVSGSAYESGTAAREMHVSGQNDGDLSPEDAPNGIACIRVCV